MRIAEFSFFIDVGSHMRITGAYRFFVLVLGFFFTIVFGFFFTIVFGFFFMIMILFSFRELRVTFILLAFRVFPAVTIHVYTDRAIIILMPTAWRRPD